METIKKSYIAKIKENITAEIDACLNNKNCVLALAFKKDTCSLFCGIAYTNIDKKEAALSLLNSIYWNLKPNSLNIDYSDWSGTEINKKLTFIVIDSEDDLNTLKRLINELDYYLSNLDLKIAGKTATAIENSIIKLGSTIKL